MRNGFVTALLIVLSAACTAAPIGEGASLGRDNAADGITFAAERDTYAPGDSITVSLTNETGSPVGHNLCFAYLALEHWSGAEWMPVRVSLAPAPDFTCGAIQWQMPPGAQATGRAFLPHTLSPGTYRISAQVDVAGERRRVITDPFTVR